MVFAFVIIALETWNFIQTDSSTSSKLKYVYLIRHGQAIHNVSPHCNDRDPKLTELGSQQAKNIKITGWLPPEDVRNIVANADVYISTSLYEGLSFGVLEALELEKPVLLTNCIGNRDVIIGGINGDYFDNEQEAVNKILHYVNNRSMLKVMGSFSRKLCSEQFDQKRNFTTYRNIYAKNVQKINIDKVQPFNYKIENV